MINIGLPNITGGTPEQQMAQMKSYVFQMAEQLNWALATLEGEITGGNTTSNKTSVANTSNTPTESEAQSTFNSIKSLIIKSADIVEAYSQKIDKLLDLSGTYAAEANFPDGGSAKFVEDTNFTLYADDGGLRQMFNSVQTIEGDLEGLEGQIKLIRESEGYIKSGELDTDENGYKIYGLEVGQTNKDETGAETFNKFARFTADRLSFYDQNDNEVAYISDYKLFITHVSITGSFVLGGLRSEVNQADGSVVRKWVGWGANR